MSRADRHAYFAPQSNGGFRRTSWRCTYAHGEAVRADIVTNYLYNEDPVLWTSCQRRSNDRPLHRATLRGCECAGWSERLPYRIGPLAVQQDAVGDGLPRDRPGTAGHSTRCVATLFTRPMPTGVAPACVTAGES